MHYDCFTYKKLLSGQSGLQIAGKKRITVPEGTGENRSRSIWDSRTQTGKTLLTARVQSTDAVPAKSETRWKTQLLNRQGEAVLKFARECFTYEYGYL